MNLRNFRLGLICVSLAGCATNILIAMASVFLLKSLYAEGNYSYVLILNSIFRINIILGSFNLIPIPPLDGSKILMGFLPAEGQRALARLEPYGFFILIFLLFTGLLNPVITFVQGLILTFISIFI